jgi:hypothetical protein
LSQYKWPFVLAGHLNDSQHKCHQRWRLLKQPASTNAITAGGFLTPAGTKFIFAGGCLDRPPQKAFSHFLYNSPQLFIICI